MTEPKRAMEPKMAHVPPLRKEVISRQMAYYTQFFEAKWVEMTMWSPAPSIIKPETLARMTRPIVTPTPKCGC